MKSKILAAVLAVVGFVLVVGGLFLIDSRALAVAVGALFLYLGLVVVEVER